MNKTEAALEVLKLRHDNKSGQMMDLDLVDAAQTHLLDVLRGPTTEDGEVTVTVAAIPGILRSIADWFESPENPPLAAQGVAAPHLCRDLADVTEEYLRRSGLA